MTRAPSDRHAGRWRIVQWGAVTAVGTSTWQSAASWVGGQRRFRKQRLPVVADEALTIARCPEVAADHVGLPRLQALLRAAVQDFLLHAAAAASAEVCTPHNTLVLLSVPGRALADAAALWQGACAVWPALSAQAPRVEGGSNACGLRLLQQAQQWAVHQAPEVQHLLLAGVDSLSDGPELARAHSAGSLLTDRNGEGCIPGEAAACVLLSRAAVGNLPADRTWLVHPAAAARAARPRWPSSLQPDGTATTEALQAALQQVGMQGHHFSHALCDMDGSNWRALEQANALTRTLDALPPTHWEPAAFLGQVGAASAPVYLALAAERCLRDRQAPNSALLWLIDADCDSAAVALERGISA